MPILIFILFLMIFSCNPANDKSAIMTSKLDEAFSELESDSLAGGSIFVEMDGKVLYSKSFGCADFETKEAFDENTVSNLGSISKTIVAYGILKLHEQGKLSIDDPISKYFPDFVNPDISSSILIRHFLTHTSGIPDSREVVENPDFYLTANDEENFAPLKATTALEFEPGSQWNYSNPTFNGLALIIEQVSGMKWQDYIAEQIFKPSGLTTSTITDGAQPASGVAHAYIYENGQAKEYDYGEYPTFCAAGNGGVWSSIEELRKYYYAIKKNLFVTDSNMALSQKLWIPSNWSREEPPSNGMSWFVYEKTEDLPYKMVEHTGSQGGFTAIMTMIPDKDLLILMLFNTPRKVTDLRELVIKQLQEAGFL